MVCCCSSLRDTHDIADFVHEVALKISALVVMKEVGGPNLEKTFFTRIGATVEALWSLAHGGHGFTPLDKVIHHH